MFAWTHENMSSIDLRVISHRLAINPMFKAIKQKRRVFNQEKELRSKKKWTNILEPSLSRKFVIYMGS